jgi:hypothetical protein
MTPDKLASTGVYALPILLIVSVVQFIRLRVQNSLAERPDPQLGRKAILHLFLNLSILMGLVGASMSTTDLLDRAVQPLVNAQSGAGQGLSPGPLAAPQPGDAQNPVPPPPAGIPPPPPPWFNSTQRAAVALIASGLLHGVIVALVLRLATNDRTEPAVSRANAGIRLVLAGLIVLATNTATLMVVLAEGGTDWSPLATYTGIAVVWGPTAAVHLWLLLRGRAGKKPAEESHERASGFA